MPRAALTDQQIAAFRGRAVQAASHLFAERGYDAVTMRSLAAELDVSPMTAYRYFENKDDLFAQVRTEAFRRFADWQERAFAAGSDPEEKLRLLGQAYVRFALEEPDSYRIMFELRAPEKRYRELEREQRRAFSYLHRAVSESRPAGDPLTVAHLHWAQVHGLVSLHLAGKLIMGRKLEDLLDTSRKRRKGRRKS